MTNLKISSGALFHTSIGKMDNSEPTCSGIEFTDQGTITSGGRVLFRYAIVWRLAQCVTEEARAAHNAVLCMDEIHRHIEALGLRRRRRLRAR